MTTFLKIFLLCLCLTRSLCAFSTFDDLEKYAQSVPEYPEIENKDYRYPDYSTFYNSQKKNFFQLRETFLPIFSTPFCISRTLGYNEDRGINRT
jgi:hypothetical protein